jgi:hypothetical protein
MGMVTLEGLHIFDSIEDRNQKPQAGLESSQVFAHALNHLRAQDIISKGRGKEGDGNGKQYPCLLLRNKEDAGVDGQPIPANVGEGVMERILLRYSRRCTERADRGDDAGKGFDGRRGEGRGAEEQAERRTAERAVHSQHLRSTRQAADTTSTRPCGGGKGTRRRWRTA